MGKVRRNLHQSDFSHSVHTGCPSAVASILYSSLLLLLGRLPRRPPLQMLSMSVQDTSYWTAMLSCATKSHTKCDSGSKCETSQEGASAPVNLDPLYSLVVALNPQHGDSQRVSTIINTNASCRADCGNCAARDKKENKKVAKPVQLTKRDHFVKLPEVLQLFVCAQQVSPGHKPVHLFLVVVWCVWCVAAACMC